MASLDTDRLLAMLRDPKVESREIADAAGVPREEAGRASRLLMSSAQAKPEVAARLKEITVDPKTVVVAR